MSHLFKNVYLYECACVCQFLEQLKKIHFKTKEGEEVYFDKNGDPPAKYDIINWQTNKANQHEFITVGLYDSTLPSYNQLAINMDSIVWAQNKNQASKRKTFFALHIC